ncbi:hypothetical protein SO574_19775 [Vibrio alfacsensis]|uniref:hypothetical protein n=1 Tax=Vibrio alfacsensis TaxID=1074311 RepID=UPI002ADE32CB|nr:hypothetical protein [Vibrio alfacsensis]WQE78011.1 hypothetical protein SO574_19775 [Vibrio alfacsensis]
MNTNKQPHKLSFGFSATKNSPLRKLRQLTIFAEKSAYLLFTAFGTLLLTLGGAFANGYKWSGNNGVWTTADNIWSQFSAIICNPYIHFIFGFIFLIWGFIGAFQDNANLQSQITTQKNQVRPLKTRIKDLINEKNELSEEANKIQKQLEIKLRESIENEGMLKAELREKHCQLVKTWLKGTFSSLMNDDEAQVKENTKARVSIYYVYNDSFYILARYSPNAEYDRINRQKFSKGKGIIYDIYQHLEVHENELNEYSNHKPDEYYNSIEKKYGYKQEQLNAFNMKSSRYFGRAIREADVTIGIILFESTNTNDLNDLDKINQIRTYLEKYWSHLSQFVRHGIEHDISCKYHENLKSDQDVLQKLERSSTEMDILEELSPKTKGQQK